MASLSSALVDEAYEPNTIFFLTVLPDTDSKAETEGKDFGRNDKNDVDSYVILQQEEIEREILLDEFQYLKPEQNSPTNLENEPNEEEVCLNVIHDIPVVSRAKATLPLKFLYFKMTKVNNIEEVDGVYVKMDLEKNLFFGPMEGILVNNFEWTEINLVIENNFTLNRLDVSDENTSNWMRYVRPATNSDEQNLSIIQHGGKLYYGTTRIVKANEELKVWYSPKYAKKHKLPLLLKQDKSSVNCSRCNNTFSNTTLLNLHLLSHAASKVETNYNIEEFFTTDIPLSNSNINKCDICGKHFTFSTEFVRHYKNHMAKKNYECPICRQMFKLSDLKEHTHSHCVNGVYTCPSCQKEFQRYKDIRNHIKCYHVGKIFKCPECFKCFHAVAKLKSHQLSHSDYKEFSCITCCRQFKRKDKLAIHIKRGKCKPFVVEEVQPNPESIIYKCNNCSRVFKRRGMLINHVVKRHPESKQNHEPEFNLPVLRETKDYFCQYCEKVYKSSSKRKNHILKYHPGQNLPLSEKKVPKGKNVERGGINTATFTQINGRIAVKPQHCQWCESQYATRAKLLQHQRNKHSDKINKDKNEYSNSSCANSQAKLNDSLLCENTIENGAEYSIIDDKSLKTLKGVLPECAVTEFEFGQDRSEYFKIFQTSSGISITQPVEVWDPVSMCQSLSPKQTDSQSFP